MTVDNNLSKVKNTTFADRGQARISCPPTLANNLDTLKISFWISWSDDSFLEEIKSIKDTLQQSESLTEAPYHCPGGFNWNVQRTGVKLYNFRLLAGDLRLFLNHRSPDHDIPNVRLEIGSESCWAPGYNEIYTRFIRWIEALGGIVQKEIVSEAHLALDLVGLYIGDLKIHDEDYWIKRSKRFDVYKENRCLTGISIGRDACALRIYDKVFEIARSGSKQETFKEFWLVEHYADRPVTRIEFQLRRKLLKTLKVEPEAESAIDTLEDLNAGLNSIWQFCTIDRARHCSSIVDYDSNHQSRAENSDFWNLVNSVHWSGDALYSQQKARPKKDLSALRKQTTGLAMTIAAFYGANSEDLDHIISISKHVIEEDLISLYRRSDLDFIKKMDKKHREIFESVSTLHNLRPVHPEYGGYPAPYSLEPFEGEPYA